MHLWKLIISLSGLSIWLESKFVYFEKILSNNIVKYVYYEESYYKVFFKNLDENLGDENQLWYILTLQSNENWMLLPSSSRGYLFLQSFIYSSISWAHVMNCAAC